MLVLNHLKASGEGEIFLHSMLCQNMRLFGQNSDLLPTESYAIDHPSGFEASSGHRGDAII